MAIPPVVSPLNANKKRKPLDPFKLHANPHAQGRYGSGTAANSPLLTGTGAAGIAGPAGMQAQPVPGASGGWGDMSQNILQALIPGAIGAAGAVTPLGLAGALAPTLLPMGLNMLMGESEQDKNYAALRQQQQGFMQDVLAPGAKGQGPMFRALGEQIADRSKGQMQQTMQRAPTGTSIAREQFRRQKAQEGMEYAQGMPQLLATAQTQYQQAMQDSVMQAQQDRLSEQTSRQGMMNALTGGLFTDTSTGEGEGTSEMSALVKQLLPVLMGMA